MSEPVFTLTLTLSQINAIVACMGQGPFEKVNALIAEFEKQMKEQAKQE